MFRCSVESDSAILYAVAHQAHSGHGIFQARGDLPDPGIEPASPALQVDSLPAEPSGKPSKDPEGQFFGPFSHQANRMLLSAPLCAQGFMETALLCLEPRFVYLFTWLLIHIL